jgi:hypothetical protein
MNFDDLIDVDDLEPGEEDILRRVHALLVEAGPPADLPPALARPADPDKAQPPEVPLLFRRRRAAGLVVLLAAALAAFAGGYAFGHSKPAGSFHSARDVPMHSTVAGRYAVIHIAKEDSVGNWPMLVDVTGLPEQPQRAAYYELWLTRNGKPIAPCGAFRVHGKTTDVRLSVPYSFKGFDGWVVTAEQPGDEGSGPVVLTT